MVYHEHFRKHNIPVSDCRGQGYENAYNKSRTYKGIQSQILQENPKALFS